MVHKNWDTKQSVVNQPTSTGNPVSEKVNLVHNLFFLDQKTIRVLLSKNVENVGATELIKDEKKNHFKTAIKAKNVHKKLIDFVGKMNETKLTCFNFVVCKGLTLVTLVLVGKTLKV
jgi:hypothetical protein